LLFAALLSTTTQAQQPFVRSVRFLPPTNYEARVSTASATFYADRKVYWNDDPVGQFLLSFLGQECEGKTVGIELTGTDGASIVKESVGPMSAPKAALLLAVGVLKPGSYVIRATLPGEEPVSVETAFTRADRQVERVLFPEGGIPLEVEPQSHVPNGAWPICTGIPFPTGTLTDERRLGLFADGERVPCQMARVSTWHPEAEGSRPSIRWAHLNLMAQYVKGKAKQYCLRLLDTPSESAGPRVSVSETETMLIVDTGVVKFAVSRSGFAGISEAWYDVNRDGSYQAEEKVIQADHESALSGPYLVDSRNQCFESAKDKAAEVVVEENGPLRVVIAAKGWFVNPSLSDRAGKRLCQFVTRLFAYAGRPEIRFQHYTIITFDTDRNRLLDVGFRVPTAAVQGWSFGVDGGVHTGTMPAKHEPVFLHQYRWNRVRIGNVPGEEKKGKRTITVLRQIEGEKSDGWGSVVFPRTAMTVLVRNVWQKFPRELAFTDQHATVHLWPRHGKSTFTDEEMFARSEIYKLRWHHHGPLLDLRLPGRAYERLRELNEEKRWDYQGRHGVIGAALNGNAQGASIAVEFCLRFHEAREGADMGAYARLYQHDPHARANPEWSARSLVEGRLAPRDASHLPAVEKYLDSAYPSYLRAVVDRGAEYGMWIYANTHNNVDLTRNQAGLHRAWQASHYRHVWAPWLLYFRGNTFEILRWARANTDNFMEIGTIAYADPEAAPIKSHVAGAMYHAKGLTPWGKAKYGQAATVGYAAVQGHYINPDSFLLRYFIEGHPRARDLYTLWADAIKSQRAYTGASREVCTTCGELLSYYQATWDPDVIPLLARMTDSMLSRRFSQWPSPHHHSWFHCLWFLRVHDFLRDPRVVERVREYYDDGYRRCLTVLALLSREGKAEEVLSAGMGYVHDRTLSVYEHPDDPLTGAQGKFVTDPYTFRQQLPYYLQALKDAGIDSLSAGASRPLYPSGAAHDWFIGSEQPAVEALMLDAEDRPFTVKLDSLPGHDVGPLSLRVRAPNGDILLDKSLRTPAQGRKRRYLGRDMLTFPFAADGQKGLYTCDLRSHFICFRSPYSDLPVEGVSLPKDRELRYRGRLDFHLLPVGQKPAAVMEFRKKLRTYQTTQSPTYLRLTDRDGDTILETTLLLGGKRSTATATLDPAGAPAPYRLYMTNYCHLKWTGEAERLVCARSAGAATALAAALNGKQSH